MCSDETRWVRDLMWVVGMAFGELGMITVIAYSYFILPGDSGPLVTTKGRSDGALPVSKGEGVDLPYRVGETTIRFLPTPVAIHSYTSEN